MKTSVDDMIPPSPPESRLQCWMLAAALALSPAVAADSTGRLDRDQPATIESDSAEIDRATGISRYYGNVEFAQGELKIFGDRLIVTAPEGTLRRAEADGEPARIHDVTEEGERLRARARNIVYEPEKPLLTLTGSAEIVREGDRFNAARIRYQPDTGRVEAERGDDNGERVRITIQPETMDGENGDE